MPKDHYKVDRRAKLTANEIKAMKVSLLGDDSEVSALQFDGKCPDCEHAMRDIIPVAMVANDDPSTSDVDISIFDHVERYSTRVRVRRDDTRPKRSIVVSCQCGHAHANAKEGAFGCGTSWMVTAQFDSCNRQEKVGLSSPTEAELALWDDVSAFNATAEDALNVVRDSGDKWQKALAGILAAVGITAIVGGRDALAKLDNQWAWAITIAVAAVLLMTAWATYNAHLAALGFPSYKAVTDNDALKNFARDPLAQAKKGAERIETARFWTTIALVTTVAVLCAMWRAPDKPKPAEPGTPAARVMLTDGDNWPCATLTQSGDATKVKITFPDNTQTEVAWRDIAKLSAPSCAQVG